MPPTPKKPAAAPDDLRQLRYEEALAELEAIVERMESGGVEKQPLSLEDSLAAYKRGIALLKHCEQQLADAEKQLQILEGDKLVDFEPE